MKIPAFCDVAKVIPDHLTYAGAHRLAKSIEAAWKKCGHEVRCEVYAIRNPKPEKNLEYEYWAVRSNLINGLPQKALLKLAA